MPDNCSGGTNATLVVSNDDCACVSISSIVWNPAGTQFTITLSNGQAITSPVLTGATGAAPTVSFRVSGTELQYSINGGTTWVALYDLSLLIGSKVLANQYPNLATLGTAFESLLDGRTPYSLPTNTLSTNLDFINIHAVFSATGATTSATQRVRVMFNGSALNSLLFSFAGGLSKITIDVRLSRITNATAKFELMVTRYSASIGGGGFNSSYYQNITSLAGLDFAATAYNIDAQGDSDVIGDITCDAFSVTYQHKL